MPSAMLAPCHACGEMVEQSTLTAIGNDGEVCPGCYQEAVAHLPESWKPEPKPAEPGVIDLPVCDLRDPAMLAAFYGPFGWADHLRKARLSNVSELIRAQYANATKKPSEDRIDDLAHNHPLYVSWLVENLAGRVAYEREVLKRGIGS